MENPQGKFPAEFDTYQEVKKGDFVFCLFDVEETPRTVGLSDFDGMITGAYTVLEVRPNFDRNFLYYFYLNLDSKKRLKPLYRGLRNTIPKENFFSFKTFLPPLKEQTTIAHFLDKKTALINKAIAQKKQLIERLRERRQILIHQAVTRGLNPNVEMKDSGVDELGKIPSHWQSKKLKFLLDERNERTDTGEETLFMMSQIHGLVIRADYHSKSEVAQSTINYKKVYENDLVFNKLKSHLGVFFKSKIKEVGIVSPDYAVYYSKGEIVDMILLEVIFRHPVYIKQFICKATGIVEGLTRLYTDDLFSLKIPLPPPNEQIEIVNYIKDVRKDFSIAIKLKQKEISKLKEYKTTLINAAVTGKIKIPIP